MTPSETSPNRSAWSRNSPNSAPEFWLKTSRTKSPTTVDDLARRRRWRRARPSSAGRGRRPCRRGRGRRPSGRRVRSPGAWPPRRPLDPARRRPPSCQPTRPAARRRSAMTTGPPSSSTVARCGASAGGSPSASSASVSAATAGEVRGDGRRDGPDPQVDPVVELEAGLAAQVLDGPLAARGRRPRRRSSGVSCRVEDDDQAVVVGDRGPGSRRRLDLDLVRRQRDAGRASPTRPASNVDLARRGRRP